MEATITTAVKNGKNMCVLGQAGTGKTTVCTRILSHYPHVAYTAASGIAACNISGQTLHSFGGIVDGRYGDRLALEAMLHCRPEKLQQIRGTKILFIDEISMVSGRILKQVEEMCRLAKGSSEVFGGIQLVLCGDFWQLPPVCSSVDPGEMMFSTPLWQKLNLKVVVLKTVRRCTDHRLSLCVSSLAAGEYPPEAAELIHQLSMRPQPPPIMATTICGTNDEVDNVNRLCLHSLSTNIKSFKAYDKGNRKGLDILAPKEICLKIGASVFLTVNISVSSKLVNGRAGIITAMTGDLVNVCFEGNRESTPIARFTFTKNGGIRSQFPLKLCWSKTVHKCQSATLSGMIHIVADTIKRPGQLAVALSRTCDIDMVSISGVVTVPPARPDVAAFYAAQDEEQTTEMPMSQDSLTDATVSEEVEEIHGEFEPAVFIPVTMAGYEYTGDNLHARLMWNMLANFRSKAAGVKEKEKAYAKSLENFIQSRSYANIAKQIGRVAALELWRTTRRAFAQFCASKLQSESATDACEQPTNVINPRCLVDFSKLRTLAGYTAHRLRNKLTDIMKQKWKESIEKVLEIRAMKQWVSSGLIAERADVLGNDDVGEVEFFQKERFSLTHVTNEFFRFFECLDTLWIQKMPRGHPRAIPVTHAAVADNAMLWKEFEALSNNSGLAESLKKILFKEIIKIYMGTAASEYRMRMKESAQKQKTLRTEVYAATKGKRAAKRLAETSAKRSAPDQDQGTEEAAATEHVDAEELATREEVCLVCKLDDKLDEDGTQWIACTECKGWYHQSCLVWSDDIFEERANSDIWICANCCLDFEDDEMDQAT